MMKLFKTLLLVVATIFVQINWLHAQSVTVTPNPAVCPGQGSAVVTTTDITNPVFQLKDSAGINIGSGNTTGNFLALDAGNYQVQVTGEGSYNQTFSFTVVDGYTPIPTPNIVLSGFCDNTFTIGGQLAVNIAPIAGKTYEYKVVKTNNPNFPDSDGTYVPVSTITHIAEFGTYQVRIKDECGQIITIQRDIQPTLQEIKGMYFGALNNQACGSNLIEMASIQFFSTSNGGGNLDFNTYLAAGGVKVEMWEKSTPGLGSCPATVPGTAPIFSEIITQVNSNTGYLLPLVASNSYIVRVTTPCGQSNIFCYTIPTTPGMIVVSSNEGCGTAETMSVAGSENFFMNFPVVVTIKDSSGTVVYTETQSSSWWLDRWKVTGLPMDDYTVTYVRLQTKLDKFG